MRRETDAGWPGEPEAAGRRSAEAWEAFFSSGGPPGEEAGALGGEIEAVKIRHEDELLGYPNVVGVATGIRTRNGKPSGERSLVVYVTRKVPESDLGEGDVLPREVEGVPVDVVEAGRVEPLPA